MPYQFRRRLTTLRLCGRAVLAIREYSAPHATLATLVLPLALTAAGIAGIWWLLPPISAAIWWCSLRDEAWQWFISVESGIVGIGWGTTGAYAIVHYRQSFALVVAGWILAPLSLATFGWYIRLREKRR